MANRFAGVKVPELKAFCKSLHITVKGNKAELIEKLTSKTKLTVEEMRKLVADPDGSRNASIVTSNPSVSTAASTSDIPPVARPVLYEAQANKILNKIAPQSMKSRNIRDLLARPLNVDPPPPAPSPRRVVEPPVTTSNTRTHRTSINKIVNDQDDEHDCDDWWPDKTGLYLLYRGETGCEMGKMVSRKSTNSKIAVKVCTVTAGKFRLTKRIFLVSRDTIEHGPFDATGKNMLPDQVRRHYESSYAPHANNEPIAKTENPRSGGGETMKKRGRAVDPAPKMILDESTKRRREVLEESMRTPRREVLDEITTGREVLGESLTTPRREVSGKTPKSKVLDKSMRTPKREVLEEITTTRREVLDKSMTTPRSKVFLESVATPEREVSHAKMTTPSREVVHESMTTLRREFHASTIKRKNVLEEKTIPRRKQDRVSTRRLSIDKARRKPVKVKTETEAFKPRIKREREPTRDFEKTLARSSNWIGISGKPVGYHLDLESEEFCQVLEGFDQYDMSEYGSDSEKEDAIDHTRKTEPLWSRNVKEGLASNGQRHYDPDLIFGTCIKDIPVEDITGKQAKYRASLTTYNFKLPQDVGRFGGYVEKETFKAKAGKTMRHRDWEKFWIWND